MTAEPTTPLPESPFCRVRARVASIWADGPDAGTSPDWRPAVGEKVTLTPSIGAQLLVYDVAGASPIIVTVERVECVVDEDGWLAKSDGRPVFIAPTDDPLLSATGWTWTASIKGKAVPFSAPAGGVVDLALYVATPAVDAVEYVSVVQIVADYITANPPDVEQAVADYLTANPPAGSSIPSIPSVATLIGGQVDETPAVTNCTLEADTAKKRIGTQSWRITTTAAATATISVRESPTPVIDGHIQALGMMIYVDDPSLISTITANFYTVPTESSGHITVGTSALRGSTVANLKQGWNILRWLPVHWGTAAAGGVTSTIYGARVNVVTKGATSVNVQQVFAEVSQTAKLVFIHDGGYALFDQPHGYGKWAAKGWPMTWAINVGVVTGPQGIGEARLAEIAAENNNSISFHGWDDTTGASMTQTDAITHTLKTIRWLAARGYAGRIARSAWFQNAQPHSNATDPFVLSNPMYGEVSTERLEAWPYQDRYNVNRIQLHGASRPDTAWYDNWFTQLEEHRGVMVCYTHSVSENGSRDMLQWQWDYFLEKVQAGVDAGWLEVHTLESLLAASGTPVKRGLGGALAVEWPAVDGTVDRFMLP